MKVTTSIKAMGKRYGTVGWLKSELENGNIVLEERNDYYLPVWSGDDVGFKTKTHGLIIRDRENKHSAILAYRHINGEYGYAVTTALGEGPQCQWSLCLTEAAFDALKEICAAWIEEVEREEPEKAEITVTIQRNAG